MSENEYILQMKNIRKTFGKLVANDNVTFNVKKGTVHALIGENGAGKSTLMNILTCIHKPDHGDIIINGEKMAFRDSLDAARHGIGMVYQEFMLFKDLSIADNIMMGFEEKKLGIFLDKKKSRKKIEEICEKYHFNIPLDEKVKDCPGLFVGCLLANLISSYGLLDIVFGSLATLVAAALTTRIKRRWLVPLPSVLINAVVIGAVIAYSSVGTPDEGPFLLFAAQVGLGQLLSCYGLGMPLMLVLDRLKDKLKWTEETTR